MLYKMDVLCIEKDLFSVVNIRLNLSEYSMKKSLAKLMRKNLGRFRVEINPARVDRNREFLYQLQKPKFRGFIHHSLHDYLHAGFFRTVFDTWEVSVFDEERLVAMSYFDKGSKSIASLLGLQDPEYAKHSLGIFTMLVEIEYARSLEMKWYYPGYVLDKESSFNYKLRLGDFEFYNHNKRWVSFDKFRPESFLSNRISVRLDELKHLFTLRGWPCDFLYYPYFSMGFMSNWDTRFVKFPMLVSTGKLLPQGEVFISYDIENEQYVLFVAAVAEDYGQLVNMEISEEYQDPVYICNLLKEEMVFSCSPSAEEMVNFIEQNGLFPDFGNFIS
jgi:arginine-tRNA-protein transferase